MPPSNPIVLIATPFIGSRAVSARGTSRGQLTPTSGYVVVARAGFKLVLDEEPGPALPPAEVARSIARAHVHLTARVRTSYAKVGVARLR